jgi:hypothetical protein
MSKRFRHPIKLRAQKVFKGFMDGIVSTRAWRIFHPIDTFLFFYFFCFSMPIDFTTGLNPDYNIILVRRAQGTTEYLIILAVVIVIALIVVSIMGWMPGMGATITEKQSSTYWASLSPLAITSYAVFSDGSIQFAVRNSSMQTQTLSAIYLNDENALKAGSVTIQPASTSTVYGYVTNSANRCTAGTTFTYNVKLKYGSQYLQNKSLIGEKPLVGTCADSGAIGVWHFDEGTGTTASDSSGNDYHGTINGATWVDGKISKALDFDGTTDYVRMIGISTYSQGTIAFWLYPRSTTTIQGYVAFRNSTPLK